MSADDSQFWDLLSSVPNHVREISGVAAGYIDKAVDAAADQVRDTLSSTPWVPEYARPQVSAPPPTALVHPSTWDRLHAWVDRHRVASGVIVGVAAYATYRTVRSTRLARRSRRARRAKNGGRQEVVVIAGSPSLPLTKSLSLDLERRGFIVFVICNSIDDEVLVQAANRPDIRGLSIDITDPTSASASIERFVAYLQTPHAAVPRAKPAYLTLNSVILIPSLHYQTSPIATIPPSSFADLFNTHLLQPILTVQAFLPLLTSRLTPPPPPSSSTPPTQDGSSSGSSKIEKPDTPPSPKVLVFTPSIISSINPPFHAPEATICSALSAFTEVLTGELRPLSIPVTHVELGTFDFTGFVPARGPHSPHTLPPRIETSQWSSAARVAYGSNYESTASSAISAGRVRGLRGSSLRDLHHAVFDVLDGSNKSDVVRVGLGAGLYGFVGRWAPRSLVAWMMGMRRVHELSTWQGPSPFHSGSSSSEAEKSSASGSEGGEYIAVGKDYGANVWSQ
ncbi:DUF1776-domain-containing protein [Astrocystis sublimbata]|nr:DUF1776-domain-containing protein [Astrocystis sublimbata]